MTGIFYFAEMFKNHIDDSNLKMPENFEEYDPEEYPHFHVFMIMHLGQLIEISALKDNANIISAISDEDIKKITPEDLFNLGLELGHGIPV